MSLLTNENFIDDEFSKAIGTRFPRQTNYVNGKLVVNQSIGDAREVDVRPATERQIEFLASGGERVIEVLNLYVNTGDIASIEKGDYWMLSDRDGTFKAVSLDKRLSTGRCRVTVSRLDD